MNNFENLVPPLELCLQIPEGKFADSALVAKRCADGTIIPAPRDETHFGCIVAPAPTLEEILDALVADTSFVEVSCQWQGGWHADADGEAKYDMVSAVNAAMKLWMEINKGDKND